MNPLEAAARELALYNTIPEPVEGVWPNGATQAHAAISSYLKACEEMMVESAVRCAWNNEASNHYKRLARAVLTALEPKK